MATSTVNPGQSSDLVKKLINYGYSPEKAQQMASNPDDPTLFWSGLGPNSPVRVSMQPTQPQTAQVPPPQSKPPSSGLNRQSSTPAAQPPRSVSSYPETTQGGARASGGGISPLDISSYPAPPSGGAAGSVPMSSVNSSEPGKMSEQDRQAAYGWGNDIDADLQTRGSNASADEKYFKEQALKQYQDLSSTPGYTEDEAADITRKKQYEDLNWNPQYEQDLQLTEDEKAGIAGNPNAGYNYYDPAFTQEIANNTSANVRGAFGRGQAGLNETLQNTTRLQQGAYDPSKMAFSEGVGNEIDATVADGSTRMRDAADYNKLALDPNFKQKYEMGDQERDALVGRAQRQVGTQYKALNDDIELRAAQSGNASPQAVAAMKGRMARQSAVDMADARANAELDARAAQRGTYQTAEQMRLGAEQNYASLAAQIESDLISKGVDAKMAKEQARVQAEQAIASLNAETAKNISRQHLANASAQQVRQMGMEADLGAQEQAANQFNQNTGISVATTADNTASTRAAQIAGNRQDVKQYAQQAQYDRGMGVNNAISQGAQTVANARREGQQEVRGYLTGQQAQASDNVNTANQQRTSNMGTTLGAANTATGNKQQYELGKSGQGWGAAIKTGVAGAISNLAKKP